MDSSRVPSVTVVVVARNEERNISACMRSLARQDYPNLRIVLVDDGSTDATIQLARAACPAIEVISSPTRSISRNRNIGWRQTASEHVAFLDADCEAPPHWISTLMRAALDTKAAAVGGGNRPPGDETAHYSALAIMLDTYAGSRGSLQGKVPAQAHFVSHLPGLNVLYRRDALQLVGGFDERFVRMGEDEDLSHRLGNVGLRLYAVPDATVVHRQRPDILSWARNMRQYGRGRTALLRRHPKIWSPLFLVPPLTIPLLPVYLLCIAAYALWACFRRSRLDLWPRVAMLFLATHLPYGLGQLEGALRIGDGNSARFRRRRIALMALKNAGNKGDEAIVKCVADRMIARTLEASDPTDLYLAALGPTGFDIRPLPERQDARDRLILDLLAPASHSRHIRVTSLLGDGLRCLRVVSDFQAIVISGGQWLHDLSLARHLAVCGLFGFARLCGTATGVFCVGVGPLKRRVSRLALRCGFGAGSLLVTRDDRSTALLRSCGRAQARSATDPALELPTATIEAATGRILLSPCAWVSFENLYALEDAQIAASLRNWRSLVQGLRGRGFRVAILPTMNPEDSAFAQAISADAEDVEVIDCTPLTPSEVQGHIASARALISMRLHPLIFASNCDVPFIALNYADKVRAYCDQCGNASRLVDLAPDWADAVLKKFDALPTLQAKNGAAAARKEQLNLLEAAYSELFRWAGLEPGRASASKSLTVEDQDAHRIHQPAAE